VCPWNRFAQKATLPDFDVRNELDASSLVSLFAWDEQAFDRNTRGSAIRRIGHERWLRNVACGLGNAATSPEIVASLRSRAGHASALVREHVAWALAQHRKRTGASGV
jgi:epoxyqueuosine reductase